MKSFDINRTGSNLQETTLTPNNVKPADFGKLWTVHTDGEIYGQPLYLSELEIFGARHNVVIAATMRNTVYAIDADSGTVLWSQNFGTPIVASEVEDDDNIVRANGVGAVGILGTPVIDPNSNYMYFVSGEEWFPGAPRYSYNLNAIDITTGSPVLGSPMRIQAQYQTADLANALQFNPKMQNQRAGLVLSKGNVYICFGSHNDLDPYYGWIMEYSASTLQQSNVYVTTSLGTPSKNITGGWGGVWMGGQAPVIDGDGNMYVSSGNGSFGTTPKGAIQTGNSFIKLSKDLDLLDHFTPYNTSDLNNSDGDLGSSGLLLIPYTNYLLGGGKQGTLYLTYTDNLGGFNTSYDQVRQEFQAVYGNGTSHIHGGATYFDSAANGPTMYVWGENDVLRVFSFNAGSGMLNPNPFMQSSMTAPVTNAFNAMPGGFLSISSNGNSNGILWASTPYAGDAAHQSTEGVLYAFDAANLNLLWSDKDNDGRDDVGIFAKFLPPIVANGKMYVPNFGTAATTDQSGNLMCYGLLLPQLTVGVANATMAAGSAVPTLTGTVTGLQNGDRLGTNINVNYSTTAMTTSPAGTYPITATVTGPSAGNYSVVIEAGTMTVTAVQKPTLTVSANNATRVYNSANPAFSGTMNGAQNGDTFSESFATTATTTSNVGSYQIVPTASGADLNNYNVTTDNGTLTITQATQTISFPAIASRAYGNTPLAVTATSSAGSNYPVTITVQSGPAVMAGGTVNLTGVGTVVLLASQPGDANYSAATATQTFTVTTAQLTATASNATRVYHTANPTFSGTVTGAVGNDTFTENFATAANTASNVGSYPIVPAVSGAQLPNYTVNVVNGALTVTAAPTTTTLSAPSTANASASVLLSANVTSTAGTPAGVVTFYSGTAALGTGTLDGSGSATLSTSALAAGTDVLTASYAATANFTGSTSAPTTVTFTATSQTIAFPAIGAHAYGSAPFAVSATSSLGSSYPVTISVQSGPATLAATPGGGSITVSGVGTVVLLAAQAGDTQHYAATATQSFQVTPAALSVTAANATRAFAAANPTFTGTVTGAVGSDSFNETFSTVATTSSSVGSYPIVPAVSGPVGNYTVVATNGALTVAAAATTTAVSAPASATTGSSVTLTATVTSSAGTPAGSVTFTSGGILLGTGTLSGGVANVNTTALPTGADTVTATYTAEGNFAASTGTANLVGTAPPVAPPVTISGSYAVAASPTELNVQMGKSVRTMLTFTPSGSYTGTIALSCANLPANASCTFAQNSVTLTGDNQSGTVSLMINTTMQSAGNRAPQSPANPALLALAFWWPGGLTGLAVFARKRRLKAPRWAQLCLLLLCTCAFAIGLSGCGMSGLAGGQTTSQVTVVAAGTSASGVTTQKVVLSLTVLR